jgi:hypothetical protein
LKGGILKSDCLSRWLVGKKGAGRWSWRRASMLRHVLGSRQHLQVCPAGVRPFRGARDVVGMAVVVPCNIIRIATVESHNPVERVLPALPCEKKVRSVLALPSAILVSIGWLRSQRHFSSATAVHPAVVPNPRIQELMGRPQGESAVNKCCRLRNKPLSPSRRDDDR